MSNSKMFLGLSHVAKLREEIEAEKASALGRVSDRLARCSSKLAVLAQGFEADEIDARVAAREFNALRDEALELRWFLEVQRDALGIHDHEPLYQAYPIPDRIPSPE